MAEDEKFKIIGEKKSDKNRSSSVSMKILQGEAKRELRKEKKRLKKLGKEDLISVDAEPEEENVIEAQPENVQVEENNIKNIETNEQATSVEKPDLDEIKRLQKEIRKEKGEEEVEIDTHYKKEEPETNEQVSTDNASSDNADETNSEIPPVQNNTDEVKQSEEVPSNNPQTEVTQTQSEESENSFEDKKDSKHSTETYREKEEIDKKLKENDNVSRVDDDEIAKIKRELAIEKGIISADDVANQKNAKNDENLVKTDSKPSNDEEKGENPSGEQTQEDALKLVDDGFYEKKGKKPKKASDGAEAAPPEESLPDNITDQDIEQLLLEQEKEAEEEAEKEEEESYEGMTEQEIEEAKERKKKFNELKQRYNAKETSSDGEVGDYKKNLDFSVNTSIKRFKVKPPKKPFIITAIVLLIVMVAAALTTYFILNRPDPPIEVVDVKISQDTTNQYVNETIDFNGIYLTRYYSDGTTEKVDASASLITFKTDNIDDSYVIKTYKDDTFVELTLDGYVNRLYINLTEVVVRSITVEIFQNSFVASEEIKFENILFMANVGFVKGEIILDGNESIKMDSSKLSISIQDVELEKTETGFVLPGGVTGNQTLKIQYGTYESVYIQINIQPSQAE